MIYRSQEFTGMYPARQAPADIRGDDDLGAPDRLNAARGIWNALPVRIVLWVAFAVMVGLVEYWLEPTFPH